MSAGKRSGKARALGLGGRVRSVVRSPRQLLPIGRGSRPAGQGDRRARVREPRQPNAVLIEKAAAGDSGSLALWLVLARSRHPAVARALAANQAASASLLGFLARFGRWDVAVNVARNPRCPARVHKRLAFSPHWAAVATVAAVPAAPLPVLRRLADRHDARIKMAAATNPAMPADCVAQMLLSANVYVRGVAAANPAAPPDALRTLADGMTQPAWILRAIAVSQACPEELADQLLTWIALGGPGKADPSFDPVECTGHPGSTEGSPIAWYSEQARQANAEGHPLWRVRASVPPWRRTLPLATVQALRRDPRPEVRRAVASFVGVRPRDVRELMGDADPLVARMAARVRSENRKRYLRRRMSALGRLSLRFVPAIFVVGSVALASYDTQTPTTKLNSPSMVQAAPAPYYRSGSCAVTAGWLPALSGPGSAGYPATSPPVVGLPGEGWMTCGPTSGGPEAMLVSAGSTGLAVLVSDTVRLADGRHSTDATIHVPAAHKVVLYLPNNPPVAAMTIIAADRPSFVITAVLEFGSAP